MTNLHKDSLARNHNICIFIPTSTFVLNSDSPLPLVFEPTKLPDPVVEFDVTVQIPFSRDAKNILLNLCSAGVEARPVWIRIERECLSMSACLIDHTEFNSTYIYVGRYIALYTSMPTQ